MINIKDLTFSYTTAGGKELFNLKKISFTLQKGEKVALMGANGSGKTTFIRCINGLLIPSGGEVEVDGIPLNFSDTLYEVRRKVGMVFQNPDNQIVTTTVERELAFGMENIGLERDEMRKRIKEALKMFHLEEHINRPPHLLSGGERQRLALASVWVMKPDYLILDEPTSLLDPAGREEVLSFIFNQADEGNMGILLVTQFPEEALRFDRLIVLNEGELVLSGKPVDVFSDFNIMRSLGLDIPASVELDLFLKEVQSEYQI